MWIVTKCCQQSTNDCRMSITLSVQFCGQHNDDWGVMQHSHGLLVSAKTCYEVHQGSHSTPLHLQVTGRAIKPQRQGHIGGPIAQPWVCVCVSVCVREV